MKKALLLCLTLIAATFGFAQQQLATLNHNDSITVYYGVSALQQAYNASVNGDIITLSSGTFPAIYIDKAISIRGAGMYADTMVGTGPTTVTGDLTITYPSGTAANHIRLEGIRFTGIIQYLAISHPEFIKCEINTIHCGNYNSSSLDNMTNATFINCVIKKLEIEFVDFFWGFYSRFIQNSTFINCAIMDVYHFYGGTEYYRPETISVQSYGTEYYNLSSEGTHNNFTNCIIRLHPEEAQYYTINNCILYFNATDSTNPSAINNTIGINYSSTGSNYFSSSVFNGQHLYNFNNFSSVFKTFSGNYITGVTSFELQDSIANNYLGNDGTQMGIYGGIMPFDPRVTGLNIRRWNVANRTTPDGKLAIDIEIVNEDATAEDNN